MPKCELPPCSEQREVTSERMPLRWSDWSHRIARLNAPRENGATLIEPPLALADDLIAANQRNVAAADCDLQGRSLAQLAAEAREQLLGEAIRYTRGYRDVEIPGEPTAVLLAGHQPEMFHPGVWYKNFVLARLAEKHGAVAVNLQIDSDAMKNAALRVPGGSHDAPRIETVKFDRSTSDMPFEQRAIIDRPRFESFGQRASAQLRSLAPNPLIERYWPLVVDRSRETDNLGACIAQARHQLEGAWGLQTLEIPQSRVCDLPAFRWFMVHLLAHLPRFWDTYNSALLDYRREHKVRSAAHPVPELAAVDDWLEAPLWIWSVDDARRRRLFVRQRGDELVLSDRERLEAVLPMTPESDAVAAVDALADLSAQGIRLRTRALITTLAARLILGDLFVHGIGGAKYDELTDRIIARFFGLNAPGYLVVSGTLHLPVSRAASASGELRQLRQRIRELEFHPERFLDGSRAGMDDDSPIAQHIEEKLRWIATSPTPENSRQRGRAIRQANANLQDEVANMREAWTAQAAKLAQLQRFESILGSREYGFPLFPEMVLTSFLLPILESTARSG